MARPLDLTRIRRALSELDRIAAEHPEICQESGSWSEEDVARLLERPKTGAPAKERVAQLRARRMAQGIKRITFFCNPDAQAALQALRAAQPDRTVDDNICAALITASQATARPTASVNAKPAPESLPLFQSAHTEPAPPLTCVNADQHSLIEGGSLKVEPGKVGSTIKENGE